MYDFMLLDAQWLLTRNYFAIAPRIGELKKSHIGTIASSFLGSLIKIYSEVPAKKVILVWDTYPYHKHTILSDKYKATRSYTTDEDVEKESDPVLKEQKRIEANNFKIRGEIKQLLKQLDKFGFPSAYKGGYEADDLVYLFSKYIKEIGKTAVIVSIDSDWNYWINENVDRYNPKNIELTKYYEVFEQVPVEGMSLFEFKRLYDSLYGSHNDYRTTVTEDIYRRDYHEFFKEYMNTEDKTVFFSDIELFNNQYEALDIENYPDIDRVKAMCYFIDKSGGIPSLGQWESFRSKNNITVEATRLAFIWNQLDKNYYKN